MISILYYLIVCGNALQILRLTSSFHTPHISAFKPGGNLNRHHHACTNQLLGKFSSYPQSSSSNDEIDVTCIIADNKPSLDRNIPSPLDNIIDVNVQRQSVIYEVELSREHGIDIIQGNNYAIVGKVN
jgi:hypothetical protein